jgi:iodotyrosine deiodinase
VFAKEKLDYSAVELPDRVEMTAHDSIKAAQVHLDFMRKRHSVRDFAPTPVPQAVIDAAITAAGSAPSGANHQPWHFVAISSADVKHQIRLAAEEEEENF